MKNFTPFLIMISLAVLYSCGATEGMNRTYSSVSEYLRNVPGIKVTGNDQTGKVRLSGQADRLAFNDSPLFVIDGEKIGHSLQDVSSRLNPNDIARVKVYQSGQATARFGRGANNGAVEFVLKKKKKE